MSAHREFRSGRDLLDGVVVPLVTAMSEPGRPDAGLMDPLLERLAAAGVDALMLFGSNGEGPVLPLDAADAFATRVVARWRALAGSDGRITAAISGVGTDDAIARGRVLANTGVDAVVACPPLFFAHRPGELVAHYDALKVLRVPVIAYNNPRYTGNPITPEVLTRLLGLEHVVGVKESSGDLATLSRFVDVVAARADFGLSQGNERVMVDGLLAGAHGVTPGIANFAPSVAVATVAAVRLSRTDHAADLQSLAAELAGIHRIRPGVPTTKAVLDLLGLIPPHAAAPFLPCDDADRAAIRAHLWEHRRHLIDGDRLGGGAQPIESDGARP